MGNSARPLADIAFAAVAILFAGVVFWGTLDLPPPRYEPLGSAALPRMLSSIMALLAVFVGLRGYRRWRVERTADAETLPHAKKPWMAVATVAILIVYLFVMEQRLASFIPASILAFSLFGCMLVKFEPRRCLHAVGFTIALVLASFLVFTKIFYVDLP